MGKSTKHPVSFCARHLGMRSANSLEPINEQIVAEFVRICNEQSIPILFITSRIDTRIPMTNALNFYTKLKNAGLNNCSCLILNHSTHSSYMETDDADSQAIETMVHAFYRTHNLPFQHQKALTGTPMLQSSTL